MKAIITKAELLQILSKHFSMSVTEAQIVDRMQSNLADLIEAAIRPLDYRRDKILAIRTLRDLVEVECKHKLGLADSKWAIENFEIFISFVRHHNRLPEDGFAHTGMD